MAGKELSLNKELHDWAEFLAAQSNDETAGAAIGSPTGPVLDYDLLRTLLATEQDDDDDGNQIMATNSDGGAGAGAIHFSSKSSIKDPFYSSLDEASYLTSTTTYSPTNADGTPLQQASTLLPTDTNTGGRYSSTPSFQAAQMEKTDARSGVSAVPVGFSRNGVPTAWVFPGNRARPITQPQYVSKQPGMPPPPAYGECFPGLSVPFPQPQRPSQQEPPVFSTAPNHQPHQQPQHQVQQQQGVTYIVLGDSFSPAQLQGLNGCRVVPPSGSDANANGNPATTLLNGAWPQLQQSQPLSATLNSLSPQQQLQLLSMMNLSSRAANGEGGGSNGHAAPPNVPPHPVFPSGQSNGSSMASPTAAPTMNLSPNPNPMGSTQSIAETQSIIASLQEQLRRLQKQQQTQEQREAESASKGGAGQANRLFDHTEPQQQWLPMGSIPLPTALRQQARVSPTSSSTNPTPVSVNEALSSSPNTDVPSPPWLVGDAAGESGGKVNKTVGWMCKDAKWVPIFAEV